MHSFNLIVKPDADEVGAAEVYVDGSIGGKPYRFLFDTGAAKSRVSFDEYTSAFDSTEQNHSAGVFARSSEDTITVPSIEVGPLAKQNFTLVRTGKTSFGTASLVGMDFLKDYRLHFYFDENRVSVDEAIEDGITFHEIFLDSRYHPYVQPQFGAVNANAVWDTGASLTVVNMEFIEKHAAHFQEAGQSTGMDSTGAEVQTPMFTMTGMVLGNQPFPPQRVAGVDLSGANATIELPMDLIIGYSAYSRANWIFDFPQKKWAISKWLGVH